MTQVRLALVLLPTALLAACAVSPYPYPSRRVVYTRPVPAYLEPAPVYAQPIPGEGDNVVVDIAPPAPLIEAVPPAPFEGGVWIGGYWGWRGGRHEWVPGRWDRPRAGYEWRRHAWVQEGNRWHLRGGGWVRR